MLRRLSALVRAATAYLAPPSQINGRILGATAGLPSSAGRRGMRRVHASRCFTPRVESLEGRQLLSGVVSVSSSGSVLEGNQASFQISGSNLPAGGVTVYYETTPGTATAGADYTSLSGSVFLNAPGAMVTINVSTISDGTPDPGETFSLTLTSVTGDASIGTGSASMTINEQGSGPPGPSPQYITLTSPGTLQEGQVFTLSGSVSPAGYYWLSGSINWGGFVTQMGSVVNVGTNSDGSFSFSNVYYDDGPSPGNDTASDVATIVLNVSVSGSQLSAQTTATVQNVVPTSIHPTTGVDHLTLFPSEPGGPNWVLSGNFFDPGLSDVHTITINWGDGTPPEIFTQGQGSIAGTHLYPPSGQTYTVSISITDDDLGVYNWSKPAPMYLLDLDNDANNNGAIEDIDDPIEDIYPGHYLEQNADDDDEDGLPDMSPLESPPIANEDELEQFKLRWAPANRPEVNSYQGWIVGLFVNPAYTNPSGSWLPTGAGIYRSADKSNPLPFVGQWNNQNIPGGPAAIWPAGSAVDETLYLEARSVGEISLTLRMLSPTFFMPSSDTVVFTALEPPTIDLDIDSDNTNVIEGSAFEDSEEMERPGKMIHVNWDDDNHNQVQDLEDPGPLTDPNGPPGNWVDDDDLAPLTLTLDKKGRALTLWTVQFVVPGSVKLFASADKQPLPLNYMIPFDALPPSLFVEGIVENQVTVKVLVRNPAGAVAARDSVIVTVVSLDAVAHRPNTPPFALWPIPEAQEGHVGIRRNGDDDDNNDVRDGDESPPGDDDLIRVILNGKPAGNAIHEQRVKYKLTRSNTKIDVYSQLVGVEPLEIECQPGTVDVEWPGVAGGASELEWSIWDARHNRKVFFDAMTFRPFTSVVIVLGGENQVPADPPSEPTNHGMFNFAIQEYRKSGLDVHMYDEDDVDLDGSGAAYDEVVSAIQERLVTNVAIMGYSHGGGSTYNLAWRLERNTIPFSGVTDITNAFAIPFTGYIDAIDDGGITIDAETRRPPLAVFHCAQYELNTILLHGAPSGGDIDLDRSGFGVTHFDIDDNATVLALLRFHLRQHVSP